MKDFVDDFWHLQKKLAQGENFAFSRFSDGEMDILQNKALKLDSKQALVDGKHAGPGFSEIDHKEFDPNEHGWLNNLLMDAYKWKQDNYFVGLSCPCCVGKDNNEWMKSLRNHDEETTTWANLFVNSNYPLFLQHVVPLLKNRNIYMVVNETADLSGLPFEVKNDWRVGKNAMVNDIHLRDEMYDYIHDMGINDGVFLFSASSLSNLLIHHLFMDFPENTFIDIGTTLHKQMGMPIQRNYLKGYWLNSGNTEIHKRCMW